MVAFLASLGFAGWGRGSDGRAERGILHSRLMTLSEVLELNNRTMIGFDLALGTGALAAPDATLKVLGHAAPSDDARELFRRCGPIWLTFALAHSVAAVRGRPEDWWALAWLRATEVMTDVVWSRSPAFRQQHTRVVLAGAGLGNLLMAAGFAWRSSRDGS